MRTDLTIMNATRIIIKRDASWRVDSRLYNIEVRWDYDNIFAKYCWNNEKYPLPQAITTRMASVDVRTLAVACSRHGLMYKERFEADITNDVYVQIWRKDLRDNLEEQRRISLLGILGTNTNKPKVTKVPKVTKNDDIFEDDFDDDSEVEIVFDLFESKEPIVIHNEKVSVSKVSYETEDEDANNQPQSFVAEDEDIFGDCDDEDDIFGDTGGDEVFDFLG